MREKIRRISPYVRYAIIGVLIITNVIFMFRKFAGPSQVLADADLATICQSVSGCKAIKTGMAYKADAAGAYAKIIIVGDKRTKNPELRTRIVDAIDRIWEEKAGYFAPKYEGKVVEVRHE